MKETPIIMSGNHPKLILDGIKTQTRRVVSPKTSIVGEGNVDWGNFDWEQKTEFDFGDSRYSTESEYVPDELKGQLIGIKKAPAVFVDGYADEYYPYEHQYLHVPWNWKECGTIFRIYPKWEVGDRLWVKETWATEKRYNHLKPSEIPDTAKIYFLDKGIHSAGGYSLFTEMGKIRPSIFMCEWMSRILLEITEVRVERVQDITEEDCYVEGLLREADAYISPDGKRNTTKPIVAYSFLWDSLNAKRGYGWEVNPWVWVIGFKVIK